MRNRISLVLSTLLLALMAALATQGPRLHAQETTPRKETTPAKPAASAEVKQELKHAEEGAQKTEKEADSADAMRNSSAVKFIARTTGLSNNAAYWLCVLLNFGVIAFFIAYVMRKKLPGFFKGRTDSIRARIEDARKTSEEARRRLQEVEGRLSRLDVDITNMRREADENARAEEKRIMAEAENERRRIVSTAEQEIAAAANNARRDLKAYAAELAVDLAEKRIRVGQDADRELVREFTTQLGKDGH
ncbi:MAG TPA: ATP synthase F0 subunit B [Candidatus Angelobacter sp.]